MSWRQRHGVDSEAASAGGHSLRMRARLLSRARTLKRRNLASHRLAARTASPSAFKVSAHLFSLLSWLPPPVAPFPPLLASPSWYPPPCALSCPSCSAACPHLLHCRRPTLVALSLASPLRTTPFVPLPICLPFPPPWRVTSPSRPRTPPRPRPADRYPTCGRHAPRWSPAPDVAPTSRPRRR